MIATLRTIKRSDGRVSVVLSRQPALPRDPEVLEVHPDPVSATKALLGWVEQLREAAGDRVVLRKWVVEAGKRAMVRLELTPIPRALEKS